MSPLPNSRPTQLSLGPLESEILEILWKLGTATAQDIQGEILSDPNRELAYGSVMTVLRRLMNKGWLRCNKVERAFVWVPVLSREEAHVLRSHDQLHRFLSISNPDIVAAFADSLDHASLEQLEAIAQRIQSARQARDRQAREEDS
jgi:predicted transcriptional regulator